MYLKNFFSISHAVNIGRCHHVSYSSLGFWVSPSRGVSPSPTDPRDLGLLRAAPELTWVRAEWNQACRCGEPRPARWERCTSHMASGTCGLSGRCWASPCAPSGPVRTPRKPVTLEDPRDPCQAGDVSLPAIPEPRVPGGGDPVGGMLSRLRRGRLHSCSGAETGGGF